MKYIITIFLVALTFASSIAQSKDEKTVSIDVQKNDKGHREIKVTSNHNGEETVYEWTDNGTIPADIQKKLDADNIDVDILSDTHSIDKEVTIKVNKTVQPDKEMVFITKMGDDDEIIEYEWNGEGKMPAQMKELLDEHDIDISTMESGDTRAKTNTTEIREIKKKMRVKAMKQGRAMDQKQEQKYRIINSDSENEERVMEWASDDAPAGADHEIITIDVNDEDEGPTMMTIKRSGSTGRLSNAYMGVQIESADQGAKIIEIPKKGPAASSQLQEGDIIQRVNGAKIRNMEDLLDLLHFFEPNDKIELEVLRNGSTTNVPLQLGKRPQQYRL